MRDEDVEVAGQDARAGEDLDRGEAVRARPVSVWSRFQILLGPPGSEIGTPGYDHDDKGDRTRLWDVAPLIPAEQRYCRVNSGRRELIDHVLLSHRLVHRTTEAGTGLPGNGAPALPSIGPDPEAPRGAPGSDHAPVWIRIG